MSWQRLLIRGLRRAERPGTAAPAVPARRTAERTTPDPDGSDSIGPLDTPREPRTRAAPSDARPWMAWAFGASLAVTVAILAWQGAGETGVGDALRITALASYLWFWPAYAGGALAALFGRAFRPLAARGRELGLAYAAAQLVHAGLVAWLYHVAVAPPGNRTLLFFGVALFFTYLLALLSFRGLAGRLAPRVWKALRTLGMEYIAFAFLVDFARNPFGGSFAHALAYLPFLALAIAGPGLRLAALARPLAQARRVPD